jgi:hypothetical protein
MKLDFLKTGVINTANFVPRFAFGDINMHPGVLIINLLGRLLSIYLCFQFNPELDIKSLILAILFPTLYIMYSIAVHGVDRILDLFGLERSTFEDIFKDSSDTCEERRGPDGDLPSVPADKKSCESVRMGVSDSRTQCEAVTSNALGTQGAFRDSHGVCKYTGDGTTEYRNCGELNQESTCNSSALNCSWDDFPRSVPVYDRCQSGWEMNDDKSRGVSVERCPKGCPYYLNDSGFVNLPAIVRNKIYRSGSGAAIGTATTANPVTAGTQLFPKDSAANEHIVIQFDTSDTENTTNHNFKPFSNYSYHGSTIHLYNSGEPGKALIVGNIERIDRDASATHAGFIGTGPDDASELLEQSKRYIYIFIKDWEWLGDGSTEGDKQTAIGTQLISGTGTLKGQISLKGNTLNTCGEEYSKGGDMSRVTSGSTLGVTTTDTVSTDANSYSKWQLTGACKSR